MSATLRRDRKMSFSEKLSRLKVRLGQPEWRKYGTTLLAGKVVGIAAVLLIMAAVTYVFFGHVLADDAPAVKAAGRF